MQTTGFEKKNLNTIITIIWVTLSKVKLEREINFVKKGCLMLGHCKMLNCLKNILFCITKIKEVP